MSISDPLVLDIQRQASLAFSTQANGNSEDLPRGSSHEGGNVGATTQKVTESSSSAERTRLLANWDPSYPEEKVDWYGEYVARHAPLSMSWLQQPTFTDSPQEKQDIKGIGLYSDNDSSIIVAPLDDGGVCLWDIGYSGTKDVSRGAICGRSKSGLLPVTTTGPKALGPRARLIDTGTVECVSVDNARQKAYIAVARGLNEVDLNTLQISAYQAFPYSIAALSDMTAATPLTVGTMQSLHLYDPRQLGQGAHDSPGHERLDMIASFPASPRQVDSFSRLFSGDSIPEYAPLFHPGPLSILHLSPHRSLDASSGEIYVAGRFPSLLFYDRRTFPRLRSTFHSGARLCSLASLPYSFHSLEVDLMRQNQLSVRAVQETKEQPGDTLIACGEYKGKGSLELYGLSPDRYSSSGPLSHQAGSGQTSTYKNRVSASSSKLLSVSTHGTRLVLSDGDGQVRWLERDGSTLVRRWNINDFGSLAYDGRSFGPTSGDVALKLLPTNANIANGRVDRDEILVWTGERIGLMGFVPEPRFGGKGGEAWDERVESAEEAIKQREERIYGETMRRALERQADEVRWVTGLGLGI